jgi:uncharacterized membrane protein YbjE (DUF340 family)
MKDSIIIVSTFIFGLILARFGFLPDFILNDKLSSYALYVLMLVVGVSIGGDKEAVAVLKKANWKITLVPLSVIVGSLGAVALYSMFVSSLTAKEAMAVGAGFGYYSLSSILISEVHSETLGTVALISNIIRELFTLLFSPLLVVVFGRLAPVVSGGATAMDSTLPIIISSSGKEYGLIAIFSGIVLTVLVPVIISFIFSVL